jgi:hypothetical protein
MTERFLIINAAYIPDNECWMLISDYNWWIRNTREVEDWCKNCLEKGLVTEGMIIKFVSNIDRNVFLMKWSNE